MKISPQTFFNFCANHIPVLRELMDQNEISEADVRILIKRTCSQNDELPETTWRRLTELQILLPVEPGRDFYYMADQVNRLLAYLFDEANAATPEMIRGYIQSLRNLNSQFARADALEDRAGLRLALEELQQTLRRIQSDLDETHRCILAEVGRFKIERSNFSIRDKFRRIVYWMERYVDPMVEIVRPQGPLRDAFEETERLLSTARGHGIYNDLPGLERNLRHLRVIRQHALRIFQQCRRELEPLYESIRRASYIAEGAATALAHLQSEGLDACIGDYVIPVFSLRWQYVPSDVAIERSVHDVVEYRPEPPPVLTFETEESLPATYIRLTWLQQLDSAVQAFVPVSDLLGWITESFPDKDTESVLAAFTRLFFSPELKCEFRETESRQYETQQAVLEAYPVHADKI